MLPCVKVTYENIYNEKLETTFMYTHLQIYVKTEKIYKFV